MAIKKQEVRCPWCGEFIPASGVKVSRIKDSDGTVIERRCPRCSHVLAAYLEAEGDFLPRMRAF